MGKSKNDWVFVTFLSGKYSAKSFCQKNQNQLLVFQIPLSEMNNREQQ